MTNRQWRPLAEELTAWRHQRRRAAFWWRDDDAVDATPQLEKLLEVALCCHVPLSLAVIPARATESLAARVLSAVRQGAQVCVLQHGYAHEHVGTTRKKIELDASRLSTALRRDLLAGRARLEMLFGAAALPVMVPPWNRISASLLPMLVELGYAGLSTEGKGQEPSPGLIQWNADVDVIRWRPRFARGFRGVEETIGVLVQTLSSRRQVAADRELPIGLLTHHAEHDPACWRFLSMLFMHLCDSDAVDLLGADALFPSSHASTMVTAS